MGQQESSAIPPQVVSNTNTNTTMIKSDMPASCASAASPVVSGTNTSTGNETVAAPEGKPSCVTCLSGTLVSGGEWRVVFQDTKQPVHTVMSSDSASASTPCSACKMKSVPLTTPPKPSSSDSESSELAKQVSLNLTTLPSDLPTPSSTSSADPTAPLPRSFPSPSPSNQELQLTLQSLPSSPPALKTTDRPTGLLPPFDYSKRPKKTQAQKEAEIAADEVERKGQPFNFLIPRTQTIPYPVYKDDSGKKFSYIQPTTIEDDDSPSEVTSQAKTSTTPSSPILKEPKSDLKKPKTKQSRRVRLENEVFVSDIPRDQLRPHKQRKEYTVRSPQRKIINRRKLRVLGGHILDRSTGTYTYIDMASPEIEDPNEINLD